MCESKPEPELRLERLSCEYLMGWPVRVVRVAVWGSDDEGTRVDAADIVSVCFCWGRVNIFVG